MIRGLTTVSTYMHKLCSTNLTILHFYQVAVQNRPRVHSLDQPDTSVGSRLIFLKQSRGTVSLICRIFSTSSVRILSSSWYEATHACIWDCIWSNALNWSSSLKVASSLSAESRDFSRKSRALLSMDACWSEITQHKTINQSINHPINQSINQNQSINSRFWRLDKD